MNISKTQFDICVIIQLVENLKYKFLMYYDICVLDRVSDRKNFPCAAFMLPFRLQQKRRTKYGHVASAMQLKQH